MAGFASVAKIDPDLVEWNYGDYEGRTSADIRKTRPDWKLFRDGCPGGESIADVGARADRVVARLRALDSEVLLFSSGHFLRSVGGALVRARRIGRMLFVSEYGVAKCGRLRARQRRPGACVYGTTTGTWCNGKPTFDHQPPCPPLAVSRVAAIKVTR